MNWNTTTDLVWMLSQLPNSSNRRLLELLCCFMKQLPYSASLAERHYFERSLTSDISREVMSTSSLVRDLLVWAGRYPPPAWPDISSAIARLDDQLGILTRQFEIELSIADAGYTDDYNDPRAARAEAFNILDRIRDVEEDQDHLERIRSESYRAGTTPIYLSRETMVLSMVREFFPDPEVRIEFDNWWRTTAVVSVARCIRGGNNKTFTMNVLADALEDAGCNSYEIIDHLRYPGEHLPECWVLDLILNKE